MTVTAFLLVQVCLCRYHSVVSIIITRYIIIKLLHMSRANNNNSGGIVILHEVGSDLAPRHK